MSSTVRVLGTQIGTRTYRLPKPCHCRVTSVSARPEVSLRYLALEVALLQPVCGTLPCHSPLFTCHAAASVKLTLPFESNSDIELWNLKHLSLRRNSMNAQAASPDAYQETRGLLLQTMRVCRLQQMTQVHMRCCSRQRKQTLHLDRPRSRCLQIRACLPTRSRQ